MMPWHIMENFDIDEWAELWTNEFLKIAQNNIPHRQVKIYPKDKYFITADIKKLLKKETVCGNNGINPAVLFIINVSVKYVKK